MARQGFQALGTVSRKPFQPQMLELSEESEEEMNQAGVWSPDRCGSLPLHILEGMVANSQNSCAARRDLGSSEMKFE